MKPLSECLEQARGINPQEFVRAHPHPVLIGLGVLPGELQSNPAKASGTLFLNLSPDSASGGSANDDAMVNQVFEVRKRDPSSAGERVEVGGTVESDVDIPDHTVSRSHAQFELKGGAVILIDGGSTNGTFINGTRVLRENPETLTSGDIVTFGRYSFTFYDAMAFAKLLSVQAMMRPRSASRRPPGGRPAAQLGGGGPRRGTAPRPGGRRPGPPPRRPGSGGTAQLGQALSPPRQKTSPRPPARQVVDPFLGPPRSGKYTTPAEAKKALKDTDPKLAFPPEVVEQITLDSAAANVAPPPSSPAPELTLAERSGQLLARFWVGLKRVVRWLLGMG